MQASEPHEPVRIVSLPRRCWCPRGGVRLREDSLASRPLYLRRGPLGLPVHHRVQVTYRPGKKVIGHQKPHLSLVKVEN